jgi:hypothetical protein
MIRVKMLMAPYNIMSFNHASVLVEPMLVELAGDVDDMDPGHIHNVHAQHVAGRAMQGNRHVDVQLSDEWGSIPC